MHRKSTSETNDREGVLKGESRVLQGNEYEAHIRQRLEKIEAETHSKKDLS